MTQSICMNCRYWQAEHQRCKRYPPSAELRGATMIERWPLSRANDWCGEFRPQVGGGPGLEAIGIKPEDYGGGEAKRILIERGEIYEAIGQEIACNR